MFCLLVSKPSELSLYIVCFKREPDTVSTDNLQWTGKRDSFFVGTHTLKSEKSLADPELQTSEGVVFNLEKKELTRKYPKQLELVSQATLKDGPPDGSSFYVFSEGEECALKPSKASYLQTPSTPKTCIPTAGVVLKKLETPDKRDIDKEYNRTEKCGSGSFGKVYKAKKLKIDTVQDEPIVAVKVIKRDKDKLATVANEIAVMQEMKGKAHVMGIIDFYSASDFVYLVLPLATGGTLYKLKSSSHKTPEKTKARLVLETLQGLKYLHELNIIHNDVKLDNILLSSELPAGHAVLADYGLAQQLGSEKCKKLRGSSKYMAPEMWDINSGGYDLKVDIWAVGIVAFALLWGFEPTHKIEEHRKKGAQKVAEWLQALEILPWVEKNKNQLAKPQEAEAFLSATLEKDPSKRCDVDGAIKLAETWHKAIPADRDTEREATPEEVRSQALDPNFKFAGYYLR